MKPMRETGLLVSSSIASLAFGVAGMIAAARSGSSSVLFDGAYSFLSAALTALSLPLLRLIARESGRRFQYGYAAFEPLYVILSSALILGAQGAIGLKALGTLRAGGASIHLASALGYEIVSTAACLGMAGFMTLQRKRSDSPILRVEAVSWLMDGAISAGVLAAFALALVAGDGPLAPFLPYVDPALTLALVALTAPSLVALAARSLAELLSAAPPREVEEAARTALAGFEGTQGIEGLSLSLRKVGRSLDARVTVNLSRDLPASRLSELSSAMGAELRRSWPNGRTDFEYRLAPRRPEPTRLEAPRASRRRRVAAGTEAMAAIADGCVDHAS